MTSTLMSERLAAVLVTPELPIPEAMVRLQAAGTGLLILVTDQQRLFGVLTDGDIRRHILNGGQLEGACGAIASRDPLVVQPDATPAEALTLMDRGREFVVNELPVVGPDGRVEALYLRSDFVTVEPSKVSALIMAGGLGSRLRPLTDTTPKPMLPVGNRPLLEHTLARLRNAGIHDVRVTTHYLAEKITEHFGDGGAFGMQITYLQEERPLGTGGALRHLRSQEPVFVINGDILTNVDFQAMLAFHRKHGAVATIGVRKYDVQVPYGVIDCVGTRVRALREKPVQHFMVNAGIYLIEPSVRAFIPDAERFDMTDLITRLLDAGQPVVSFPIVEYWLDVGQPGDYAQAQQDIIAGNGEGVGAGASDLTSTAHS
jgi:dTDP-glucose pyrophosphorylase/CBS domain-containing protein